MPLEPPDQQRLKSAHGYIELGMWREANAELEEIDAFCRHLPEVLKARVRVYDGLQKWDAMQIIAIKLMRWNPNLPHWFILAAYATRRAESLEKAGKILIEGEQRHPKDGTIQFNLACYESQMGNLEKAKVHLKKATAAEPQFKQIALEDLDLEPLWDSPPDPQQENN